MALQPFVGPWPFFQFLDLYTVGWTTLTGDQPVERPLPAHRTGQTQINRIQTSMPRVGLEPTVQVFERAETVHALDRAATVICGQKVRCAGNSVVLTEIKQILSTMMHTAGCNRICVLIGGITPGILIVDARWKWVVCFTSQSLYRQEKRFWHSFDRSLGVLNF
jgi:hypothetical protein